jgi:hypothetical protein
LFVDCVKNYLTLDETAYITSHCKTFVSLDEFFRNMSPADIKVYRTKRVMDMNPGVLRRTDIIKLEKSLDESDAITQTRVIANLFKNDEDSNNSTDVEFDVDLEQVLFGE